MINILLYQILACTIHEKIQKCHTKTINLKYQVQCEMKDLSYFTDHILYKIFMVILSILPKNKKKTDNPPIKI